QGVSDGLVSVLALGDDEPGERFETRTDPEGFYRLKVLPGAYDVGVKHPDHAAAIPQRIVLDGTTDERVVDLALFPPRYATGQIVNADNSPAPGVWVSYFLEMGLYDETVTNPSGAFRLSVCPGPGTVRVFPPDGLLVQGGGDVPLDVKNDDVHVPVIHLGPLPEIAGTVFGPDGTPEPNTLISSLDLDPPIWLIADAEGQFRIQLPRAPMGKARFRAEQALRFLRGDFEVDLHDPQTQKVTLTPFEPDLATREGQGLTRGVADLVGAPAHELHCDAWFGVAREGERQAVPLSLENLRGNVIVLTFWSGVDA
ncbi:MAG: carboxypeptidase regulatory-like domain-containing protein, partial [bacterium]|nr:carboxypeptidase regulatory-like domain-containing protein [bacterium]